ncbi:MAG: FtsX-like permease family protein [Proteobacteria bacterium]|nr:FtsX-like permease family protein [Pseudomonadota bacterium]MBU1686608.1 FtsX-like permease family protein [Pseudomonadota bacterium]
MTPILERHLNLLDYALTSLWRRRLKNAGIMMVFAAVIFLVASFQMLTRGLIDVSEKILTEVPDIVIQKMSAGRQEAIPLDYRERLDDIFGILKVVPRIWGYYFDETNGANYTVMALELDAMPASSQLGRAVIGEVPSNNLNGGIVLGQTVLGNLHLGGRRTFSLFRPDLSLKPLRVVGEFNPATEIMTADLILMSLADGRDLFDMPPEVVTDYCIYVANPAEVGTIARKIAARLPDTRVLTKPQIQKTYQVIFGWRSGFASICLLTALVAFAILAWDKASGLSPEEKREIGILKVIGWQTSDILALRFWESLVVSGLAFLVGCLGAYGHVLFFSGSLFRPILLGWSVIHPSLTIIPVIGGDDLLLIFTFTVVPYMAATVIPAWRSSIVPPEAAIK